MTEQKTDVAVNDLAGLSGAAIVAVTAIANGIGAIAGPLLVPAATQVGLVLEDKVKAYRKGNVDIVLDKAGARLQERDAGEVKVDPKTAFKILDEAAWADDDLIQSMWAGLFASSCSSDGDDQGAIVFVNILKQLTREQVRLIDFICGMVKVEMLAPGILSSTKLQCHVGVLMKIWNQKDLQRIDRELDYLRFVGLLESGIVVQDGPLPFGNVLLDEVSDSPIGISKVHADLTPTGLCLHLYARCNGCQGDTYKFFVDKKQA